MNECITIENWSYARYQGPQTLSMINMGAAPTPCGGAQILYYLTLTDLDYKEIYQQEFTELEQALSAINKKYSHWPLLLEGAPRQGDGCSSCHAH